MKRNYAKSLTTYAAPVEGNKKLNLSDLKAKLVACVTADIALREARAYVREHCPTLTAPQKVEIDRFVMSTIAASFGIKLVKAQKNGVFSKLMFEGGRNAHPRAYNALEYFRLTLRGLGTGKKASKAKAEKKQSRASYKAMGASIVKAHHDAGYLMSLGQYLIEQANRIAKGK
jgi:hypothetical protein